MISMTVEAIHLCWRKMADDQAQAARTVSKMRSRAQNVLAHTTDANRTGTEADAGGRIRSYGTGYLYTRIQQKGA